MSNVSNADYASIPCKETESLQRGIVLKGTLLGTSVGVLLTALPAIAQAEALDKVENPNTLALDPVPIIPVDQLVDVQPTNWAYEALRSLIEKYHCIQGQSDLTFEATRVLQRNEFAAILSTCLAQIQSTFVSRTGGVADDLDYFLAK